MITNMISWYASAGYDVMELDSGFIAALLAAAMCSGDEVLFPIVFEFFKSFYGNLSVDFIVLCQDAFDFSCKDYATCVERCYLGLQSVDSFVLSFQFSVFYSDNFCFC